MRRCLDCPRNSVAPNRAAVASSILNLPCARSRSRRIGRVATPATSEAAMFHETGAVTRFPSAVTSERPQRIERDERGRPGEIFAVLWRRKIWIAIGSIAGLTAAVAFLALTPPRYAAVTELLIDPNDLRVVENAVTSSSTPSDANTAYVESQTRVLTYDNVLRKVIETKGLDKD